MKDFSDLTKQFQKRRLRWVAEAAVAAYDIDVAKLSFVAWHTNTTWRVDVADGAKYALRVGDDPAITELHTPTEIAWLAGLASAGLPVVTPFANAAGEFVTRVQIDGVPGERACVLFEWLGGRPLAEKLTVERYRDLGRLSAAMHSHAESHGPPVGCRALTWDRVFYYPGEPEVWADSPFITAERRTILERVIELADAELRRLHRQPPILVHGDLHPDNVMVNRGTLTVFDFEDLMWAHPVQDLAITLFYERSHPDYAEFRAAFVDGYRDTRKWPVEFDGQLELLMAARTAMFVNYVLRIDSDPEAYVAKATARLERFLADTA